jgi:hypothetical protein
LTKFILSGISRRVHRTPGTLTIPGIVGGTTGGGHGKSGECKQIFCMMCASTDMTCLPVCVTGSSDGPHPAAGSSVRGEDRGKKPVMEDSETDSSDDNGSMIERDARIARMMQRTFIREGRLTCPMIIHVIFSVGQ